VADIAVQLREALRDRYVIERELGRGGMATVYLARDLKHDRLVATGKNRPKYRANYRRKYRAHYRPKYRAVSPGLTELPR
jgi:hypothetical protein